MAHTPRRPRPPRPKAREGPAGADDPSSHGDGSAPAEATGAAPAADAAGAAAPAAADPGAPAAAASGAGSADAGGEAAARLLRRLEGRDLEARLAELDRERRQAPGLVDELLGLDQSRRAAAAASTRYATPEVVWRLLEVSRQAAPASAMRQLALARTIAVHLAALRPATALHIQLRVEVSCEMAHRLLDGGDLAAAEARLREAAAELRPDLGYARALYCRALATLRRAEHRWEEALALGERAVRLFHEHGSPSETAAAGVEQGWLLLDAGDADEAVPVLERALPAVEAVPLAAVTCRLGLAIALLESGQGGGDQARVQQLLADAEWMIGQASASGDQPRLRWLAAQAVARCRRASG